MNNSQRMQQSINELEQQLKQFEHNVNVNNNNNQMKNNGMSIEERDSIVDDLLNQYRLQNHQNEQLNYAESKIDSIIGNHSNSNNNYFSNLQNVSYGAYCINDIDENENKINEDQNQYRMLDWIDTLQIPSNQHQNLPENLNLSQQQDLIYNDNVNTKKIKRNLKNLKKKQKVDITRPSDFRPFYNYNNTNSADFVQRQNKIKRKPHKNNKNNYKRSNSMPPNKKKQSLALEMAEKEEANLTFKPKINSYEFNRRIDPSVQRRLQIWNIQKKMKLNQQRKQKLEEDDYKMKENVTFQPEVKSDSIIKIRNNKHRKRPQSANLHKCYSSKQRVQDRLFEREHERIEKLEKTKQIIQSQEMEQCPFKPKLQKTKLSNKIKQKFEDRAPIWERQNDERKAKQNTRRQSKQKYDKLTEKDLTFKPKINRKSKEIVEKTKIYTCYYPINVSERLLLQNPKNNNIKQKMNANKNTNKPLINPTSEKILKESVLFHKAADDFFKRQEIYELERKMKEAEQERDLYHDGNNNKSKESEFKPNIGNAEKILAKSKRHRHRYHFEDRQQKYERLAFHDKQIIKRKTKLKAKQLQKQNTFKPKINKKSAKIGRPSSIYELFKPEKSNKLKDKIQKEAEKIFKKQHPFKPQSQSLSNLDANNDNLIIAKTSNNNKEKRKSRCMSYEQYQDEKNRKLLEARKKLDKKEMAQCTFKPQINNNKKDINMMKIMIAGWDRFKELKQLSLKKQMQIQQRQYDVFNVNAKVLKCRKKNANGTLQTVIKPFNLAINKKNKYQKQNSNHDNEKKKYSYTPETILSRQRDKVWQILKDECYDDNTSTINSSIFSTNDSLSMDLSMDLSMSEDLDYNQETVIDDIEQ